MNQPVIQIMLHKHAQATQEEVVKTSAKRELTLLVANENYLSWYGLLSIRLVPNYLEGYI
jgi:hypothetical protein